MENTKTIVLILVLLAFILGFGNYLGNINKQKIREGNEGAAEAILKNERARYPKGPKGGNGKTGFQGISGETGDDGPSPNDSLKKKKLDDEQTRIIAESVLETVNQPGGGREANPAKTTTYPQKAAEIINKLQILKEINIF